MPPKAEGNSGHLRHRHGPFRVDRAAVDVIQAPKLEPRIMRYELNDYEWTAIKPMPQNQPHGVRRVNDRRVLSANYLAFIKLASIRIWLRASKSTP
jgi:hypothetical protein